MRLWPLKNKKNKFLISIFVLVLTIGLVGFSLTRFTEELPSFELIKGKKLVGTWGGETKPSYDIPKYVDAFDKGELPIGDLITHRFSLEEINKAFDLLKTGDAGRIVIKMDKSL